MASIHVKTIMINIFMPLFLVLGAILRPSFVSLIYILLALLCAFLPAIRSNAPFPKMIYCYSLFCLVVSLATALSQFAYQLYQHLDIPDENEYIRYCNSSSIDYWFRQTGLIRVPLITDITALRLFLPELFALLGSLLTFIICTVFPNDIQAFAFRECDIMENQQETELSGDQVRPIHQENCHSSASDFSGKWFIAASMRISDAFIVFMFCIVGALNPSILNLPYFLFFLTAMTWWALYTPLKRKIFNHMKSFFKIYLAFHFMLNFAYQIEFFQRILPPGLLTTRLLGLAPLILPSNCSNWYNLDINQSLGLFPFLNFGSLLVLFYILSIQYCWTKDGIKPKSRLTAFVPYGTTRTTIESIPIQQVAGDSSSLHEELLPGTQTEIETADATPIQLQRITSEVMDRRKIAQMIRTRRKSEPGSLLVEAAQEFLYFCLYHCYVFALLSMMMWAILYHSVFGLIFLILACAIWAIVDSRKWAYCLSPLLLAYTEFLLLAQYIYSMNLNKGEIPSGHILEIIGFNMEKDRLVAFRTILLKVLFSLPFYILLRLHLREDFYNSLTGRDRLKHINYGTFGQKQSESAERKILSHPHLNEESPFVCISKLLTKYWIFLVVFCILINSPLIGEDNLNLFSIGFFCFFITLLVVFQLSFRLFRSTIFGFLTILITYSSLILIAIYCYQFPGVPDFWKKITGFSEEFSHDIGLYDYQANQFGYLFARLIKIIGLIVVTMLQLKFFHDPWIKLTKTPNNSRTNMEETDLNRTGS